VWERTAVIDLDSYFRRIGYSGDRRPTLETLRAIHVRHVEAIAFENLSPFLGWPVPLDLESLQHKLIHQGRGGYCFEQNLLFSHVLQGLGYHVVGLAARVLWNAPADHISARSHMLLRIELDDAPFIADVGFGGQTLTGPIRLAPDIEQTTPHEPFRLLQFGGEFVLQAKFGGTWHSLYRFDEQVQQLPDYEVINWYLSHHPESYFVTGLVSSRAAPEGRYNLGNNELAVHWRSGTTERRLLATSAEIRQTLASTFQLTVPDSPEVDAALERLVARL
jgi:N-hydroxyarylamine O-acetyltransferase